MRIAIAGATGRIGSLTGDALRADGHEVVPISRTSGVDLTTGAGLAAALRGVDTVVDTTSTPVLDPVGTVEFFAAVTSSLLREGAAAGVRHHVALSIAGVREHPDATPHYAGKVAQENLVEAGPVPWTIVPATQFHDFAEMVSTWTEHDGSATVPPLLMQPVAPADVAAVLAEVATGTPQGRYPDVAGPAPEDLVDLARRTRAARGTSIRLVPTWDGVFGTDLAGDAMLPGARVRVMPMTFDAWLAAETG